MKVVNFGSCNVDIVYRVDAIVRPGETVSALDRAVFPGGKGLNQSISMARAGLRVMHAGAVGTDGLFLRDLLRENGVDTSLLQVTDTVTGHAVIQIDKNGENSIVLSGGANQTVTPEFIDSVLNTMERDDVLVLQNEISNLLYLIDAAYDRGIRIFLNPSPLGSLPSTLDKGKLYAMVVNAAEAQEMFGTADGETLYRTVLRDWPHLLTAVTLGKEGCFCIADGKLYRQSAFPVKAVDTTGAGDTFTGYFIASYLHDGDVPGALRRACAAAGLSVSEMGAASSIPLCCTVRAFLQENNAENMPCGDLPVGTENIG